MSRPKNDRKVQSESGKTFQDLDTESFVRAIAVALKAEFGATPSALKTVAQLTHSNERAVRNWLDAKNGPSGCNLVILMRHSDRVLRTVLEIADRRDLGDDRVAMLDRRHLAHGVDIEIGALAIVALLHAEQVDAVGLPDLLQEL